MRLCFWRLADCPLGPLASPAHTCSLSPPVCQDVHKCLHGSSILRSAESPWAQAQKFCSFYHVLLPKARFRGRVGRFHFLKGAAAKSHDKGAWIQGGGRTGAFFAVYPKASNLHLWLDLHFLSPIWQLSIGYRHFPACHQFKSNISHMATCIPLPQSSPSSFHHFSQCPHHFQIQKINCDYLAPFIPLRQ